jgi:DNA modification methylase
LVYPARVLEWRCENTYEIARCTHVQKILSYSSVEGDVVLDPFLGSGQVAVVAQAMNRHYIGFEIVPEYYHFALRRLQERVYRIKAETLEVENMRLPIDVDQGI